MFLISSLLVLTVCYGLSAVVAEVVFTSPEERSLPAAVRSGFGFILSVLYFSAAWQWMSIEQAWMLGAALLIMYSAPRIARNRVADNLSFVRLALRKHVRGAIACVLGATVFLSPLIVGNTYGPFTEGGGDITIYADGTRYLVDRGLTSRGVPAPSGPLEIVSRIREATESDLDLELREKRSAERLATADWTLINPPAAESAMYRMLLSQLTSPFPYPPYGEFYFLDTTNNYHVYFGVQAFLYGILVASAYFAFRRSPRWVALLYLLFIVASHSLVSVFYNMYATQAQALAVCALVLPAIGAIRPLSKAGMRIYGTVAVYLWIAYVHFLSVVGPLFLVALAQGKRDPVRVEPPGADTRRAPRWASAIRYASIAIAGFLLALMAVSATQKALAFVIGLMRGRLAGDRNWFMGDQVPIFSMHWLSFLFGSVSQQHYEPFSHMPAWVLWMVDAGIVLGIAALVLGLYIMARTFFARRTGDSTQRIYFVMYAVVLVTVAVHLYWAQTYIYTQAKGAQNVLIIFYAALMLPLAAGLRHGGRERSSRVAVGLLAACLFLFAGTLLAVRAVYGEKVASQRDRAGILEPSFFSEAQRIRGADANPLVLFEPRKSTDLYVSIQPFFGARMVSTRHLGLLMIDAKGGAPYKVDASELIAPADLSHLWVLAATGEKRPLSRVEYTWKAERLADHSTPAVLLFADDYQQDRERRPRGGNARDLGMFSYLRNGTASLYLPAGDAVDIEVKAAPKDAAQYARMLAEITASLGQGVLGSAELGHDGSFVTLKSRLAARSQPRLARISRYSGEHWLNVRVDGKDVAPRVRGAEELSGSLAVAPSGVLKITASWSGISSPDEKDWVGVFPVAGDDASRLAFDFTGGRKAGSFTLSVPPQGAADAYELRLYRAGGWDLVTTSAPLVPGTPKPR